MTSIERAWKTTPIQNDHAAQMNVNEDYRKRHIHHNFRSSTLQMAEMFPMTVPAWHRHFSDGVGARACNRRHRH
jgi:hypothetical protein